MKTLLILIGSLAMLVLGPHEASAQTARAFCGSYDEITSVLVDRLGEERTGWGLGPDNRLVEVYNSRETGAWAIIVTEPNGTTCLVMAGDYWQNLTLPATGNPL